MPGEGCRFNSNRPESVRASEPVLTESFEAAIAI